jgi:signal transduction histidine kinase
MTAALPTPRDVWTRPLPRRAAIAAGTLCAATVTGAYAAAAPGVRAQAVATGLAVVGVPAAVALLQLRRRPEDRFARLLLGAAFLVAPTTLAVSGHAVPYSIGRTMVWVVEPALVYLLLAYPSGRLETTAARAAFGAVAALAGLAYLPTALVVDHFPEPSPWNACDAACPPNAFALLATEPAVVEDLIRPVREALTAGMFLAVAALLAVRTWRAVPLGRWALAPVLATAIARAATLAGYDALRHRGSLSPAGEALGVVFMLSLPMIALGFAAGLAGARFAAASALERLTRLGRAGADVVGLRDRLATALGDPSINIAYRTPGESWRWVDETGWPVPPFVAAPLRAVTQVSASGRDVAVEHDVMLLLEPGMVEGAAAYALAVVENRRLVAEGDARLRELDASRARILTIGDEARRQIERDLHDGAQQRLVALRAALAIENDHLGDESPRVRGVLEALGEQVELTIDEVRALARGIYPSVLADHGLAEALRAAGRAAPIAVRVDADGVGRYPPEIETTVYLVCVEALQNAVKHADGASAVWISLVDDGRLRFEVVDDGAGFDPDSAASGAGLVNLHDRTATLGGVLAVESAPGRGTRIAGAIPLARPSSNGRHDGDRTAR